MKVENGPYRFIISPAKSILIFDLSVVAIVLAMLIVIPIIFAVKLISIAIVVWYGLISMRCFKQSENCELQYLLATNQWVHNGIDVSLRQEQFVTRNLLILYFLTKTGKKITQLIPIDCMPRNQHIRLRKLIIEWSKTNHRGE